MVEDKFFVIERPGEKGRIKLGPEAKFWAEQNGMTLAEMARYLLAQNSADGYDEGGAVAPEDVFASEATPSVEDRGQDPDYGGDRMMQRVWGSHDIPPQRSSRPGAPGHAIRDETPFD